MFAARSQGRCSLDLSFQLVAPESQNSTHLFHSAISKETRPPSVYGVLKFSRRWIMICEDVQL